MRDLINLLESIVLDEGRGLAARTPGDQFSNGTDTITFQGAGIYPEKGGKYGSPEERDQAIAKFEQAISPHKVQWMNNPNPSMLAFGVVIFTEADETPLYYGKYFKDVKPNLEANQFGNEVPGGYRLAGKTAKKENAGMKPSDVLTNYTGLTPEDVVTQISQKFGADSYQAKAATTVLKTKGPRFPILVEQGDMDPAAFRDYFCEMLQPIAMINGTFTGSGQACADTFFGPGGFTGATITFNEGVSGALSDSLLVKGGKTIKISTKAGKGAMASSANLMTCLKEVSQVKGGDQLLSKYQKAVKILEIIDKGNYVQGPLQLGVMYGILSQADADELVKFKNVGLADVMNPDGSTKIQNPRLKELWDGRYAAVAKGGKADKINPFEHLLSAVAYKAADAVNADPDAKFSDAACDILNNSALVQVYTKSKAKNGQISIDDFYSVWPSKTANVVKLEASKSYMSSQNKGKLVFSINGGQQEATVNESRTVESGSVNAPVYGRARRHW